MWQRRQIPSQQVTTGPALIEGVERTNTMVVRGSGQEIGAPRRDPYVMKVDKERNCYACRGFGHMAYHCRNRGRGKAMEEKRVEYGGGRFEGNTEQIKHLKEVENLEALD